MAITISTGWPKVTYLSSMRQEHYQLSVGTTGDVLTLRSIGDIASVAVSPSDPITGITDIAVANRSGDTMATITFTGTERLLYVVVTGY